MTALYRHSVNFQDIIQIVVDVDTVVVEQEVFIMAEEVVEVMGIQVAVVLLTRLTKSVQK